MGYSSLTLGDANEPISTTETAEKLIDSSNLFIDSSPTEVRVDSRGHLVTFGHTTGPWGISALLERPRNLVSTTAYGLNHSNHWSSTENNSNNSWNVNFNNGNFNNNNKYNGNVVRPVSAKVLDEQTKLGWIDAYVSCCKKKKTSVQCSLYRAHYEEDLFRLAWEVENRVYIPSISHCFVVTRPKLREIFAANFRDRIVQHWIINRIEPLLEERFTSQGNVSYNCRKGFGTLSAVKSLRQDFEDISNRYTKKTYVGKFDMSSFFMSIDTEVLLSLLIPFIREKYSGPDLETLIWVTEVTVRSRPQDNCFRKGRIDLWDQLPANKSLFNNPPGVGMPIGNITSQLLANFYLSFFDEYMVNLCKRYGARYRRFVDDFVIVCNSKSAIKVMKHKAIDYLSSKLHIRLHPDKVYIQDVRKGVKFVGSVLKPGRIYLSNRTVAGLYKMVGKMEKLCKRILYRTSGDHRNSDVTIALQDLQHFLCSANSYMGFLIHCSSYKIREKIYNRLSSFWDVFLIDDDYSKVELLDEFNITKHLIKRYASGRKIQTRTRNIWRNRS